MAKTVDKFTDYINWLFGFSVAIAALLFSKDAFLARLLEDVLLGVLSIALLLVAVGWFFSYMSSVRHELGLLSTAFEEKRVISVEGAVLPTGIAISVFFGVLLTLSLDIRNFTMVAAMFAMFDLYGQRTVRQNFLLLSEDEGKILDDNRRQVLSKYYIDRPLLTRISCVLAMFISAHLLVVFAGEIGLYASYLVVIVGHPLSLIILYRWRKERDDELERIDDGAQHDV